MENLLKKIPSQHYSLLHLLERWRHPLKENDHSLENRLILLAIFRKLLAAIMRIILQILRIKYIAGKFIFYSNEIFSVNKGGRCSFFTGLDGTKIFKILFKHVQKKGSLMRYWDGSKKTVATEKKKCSSIVKTDSISISPDFNNIDENCLAVSKPGPERK